MLRLILGLCLLLLAGLPAMADGDRVALVIGVGQYRNAPALLNPANDARLVGPVLEKLGFQVQTVVDPDYDTMKSALRHFGARLDTARVAVFFYSGHGLQVAGRNYLVPTDATLEREPDLRYEAFDVQAVLDEMDAPGRVNLVFLDACRDDPFARSLARALAAHLGTRGLATTPGLAQLDSTASGTLIAFATQPGNVALDGSGANSPFTLALAHHLTDPGLEVRQMLTRVRTEVEKETNGAQRPWVNESLDADFFFVPVAPAPAAAATVAPPSADVVFWQSIMGSTHAADFTAYLAAFPQGLFVPLAQERLAELSPAPPPAATGTPPNASAGAGRDGGSPSMVDQRDVAAALVSLGYLKAVPDGAFGAEAREALRRWQVFSGLDESAPLTEAIRTRLLADAQAVAALLRAGPHSPRGVAARDVTGGAARFGRAAAFETGTGQPRDTAEAAYWYALAAADGFAPAFTNLGTLHARGQAAGSRTGRPDAASAALLWRTAAALGDGTAMYDLGVMVERGIGMAADLSLAKQWYARGAERQHAASAAALRRLGG